MRRRTTIAISLALTASAALSGCSGSPATAPSGSAVSSSATGPAAPAGTPSTPVPSAALGQRLLTEADLGQGYTRKPERESRRDDVTVIGCPALEQLGDAAAGGSLDFPNKAKTAFTYNGSTGSEVSEELYSDTPDKLADGTTRIFDAMTGCPVYQVVIGSRPVKVTTQKLTAPALGDQAWSQLLTFTAGGQESVVKQTAVRKGAVLTVVSGSPALVDTHVEKALAQAVSR
ncbi:hypothetical protein K7B10_07635 [Streptomyces flavotricini]|uniref:Secreted protein n=1 Tax=Streptomyces flavotricini TaxID=66888 RepID=A0ABS8E0I2_9ACTN|nr:hypothetical protein [Streptomyces flavotricini]MCC0094655.1 hypothetical protein [Streptomyces flavotricini]